MATTDRIYRLTVDAGQAVRELQKLNTSVGGIDSKFSALGAGIKAFGVALAAGLSVDQLISGVRSSIDAMDDMGKAAQKVGVSLSVLQDLKYMSDLSGVSFETLQMSIGKMSQAMSGFEGAGKKAADAMKALGVDLKGDTSQALAKIADQFQKMPDGAQKTALAMELFGKSGRDMIPFLNQGGDAIQKMAEEADRLGFKFNEVAQQQAERFNDAMTKIGLITKGIVNQFTSTLLPSLVAIAEHFVDGYKKGEFFSRLGTLVGDAFIAIAARVIVAFGKLQAFGKVLASVGQAAQSIMSGNLSGAWDILVAGVAEAGKVSDEANASALKLIDTYKGVASQSTAAATGVGKLNSSLNLGGGGGGNSGNNAARDAAKRAQEVTAAYLAQQAIMQEAQEFTNKYYADLGKAEAERQKALEESAADLDKMINDAAAGNERLVESLKSQAKTLTESLNPFAKYQSDLASLENLKPYLPIEIFVKALAKLDADFAKTLEPIKRELTFMESAGKILDDNFSSFFNNMQNGIAGAKEAFERMAQSMLLQLARLAASKLFDQFFGKDTSWGLANPFTAKTERSRSGLGLFTVPDAGVARSGGDPQQFVGSSGSSGVSVNVVNNAGAEIGVESRQNADGSTMIDILVERKVKGMIASGAMDRVMASTFGARRRGFA